MNEKQMKTGKYMLFHVSISLVGLLIAKASWLHSVQAHHTQ
jgi:hypothetical protein